MEKFIALFDTFSTPRKLATVYFFCFLIIVSCLALIVPPFHNSDEFAHFHRVDQISHGGLLVHRTGSPPSAGGVVNVGPLRLTAVHEAMRFHTDVKVTPEMTR